MAKVLTSLDPVLRYDAAELTPEEREQARKNIGAASVEATPEMYFDIDDDGVISLKPEYRGASPSASSFPLGTSDNGANVAGSKNSELPEAIVIPEVVNEIAVTALAKGMFVYNTAIKSLTIPSFITEIPSTFARGATNLKEIKGTENVKVLKTQAFYNTAIKKASFPNLEDLGTASSQFQYCAQLISADLGSKITAIPDKMFAYCEKLSCVRNAGNVTAVGANAFNNAKRLKTLACLPNLTQISDNAFRVSRVNYDWASLTDCTFGDMATALQFNPTDFWSGCTYTPCNTPLRSVFDQKDPRWVNDAIGNTDRTYETGCVIVSAAMIYSAFEDKDLTSPQEFEAAVEAVDSSLMDLDTGYYYNIDPYLEAVGYTVVHKTEYNAENLQAMYDALADGALILAHIDDGATDDSNHVVVIHGINANGEVMVQDPMSVCLSPEVYEGFSYAAPIQNIAQNSQHFLIVTKP